jgi:tetratricopeptide (TPR) repeat protein
VKQAILLAVVCLIAGIGGGWGIRAAQGRATSGSAKAGDAQPPAAIGAGASPQTPSPARLKEMADAQAEPLVEKLAADPNNPELLTSIGNLYYDAQLYPTAVDYYLRALQGRPSDAAVRTDMATAYWFMGNADKAIAEFNKALNYAPKNPNTLFNLGLVKWQAKKDAAGAIADWEKLLATDPHYEARDKVEQMMAEAKKYAAANPGAQAK